MPEQTKKDSPSLLLQDADLLFRNLSGRTEGFNTGGDRNFSVKLEPGLAQKLKAEGWRVKQLKPREEGQEGDYHLKVTANYKTGRPPRAVLISSQGATDLGPEQVGMLDAVDIQNVDVLINGWWSDNAGGGYGGFLKSIFVTIREDELEQMYADVLNESQSAAVDAEAE